MSKNSTNRISRLLVEAREQGTIPWAHVVDESRQIEVVPQWDNPESIIRAARDQYRKNHWAMQANIVEIWSEKGTIRGALKPVLERYGVSFRCMHGFSSATIVNDIAVASQASEKRFYGIYIGDWDPSGLYMSESDLPSRLAQYGGQVKVIRIALTEADCGNLPSFDVEDKKTDSRHRWFVTRYGDRCFELDALSPVTLRERVESAIVAKLDIDAWTRMVEVERVEKASMTEFFDSWRQMRAGPTMPGSP